MIYGCIITFADHMLLILKNDTLHKIKKTTKMFKLSQSPLKNTLCEIDYNNMYVSVFCAFVILYELPKLKPNPEL